MEVQEIIEERKADMDRGSGKGEGRMLGYALAIQEEGGVYFWTCTFGDTQNYSYDVKDCTVFRERSAVAAMRYTLGKEDHHIVEVYEDDTGLHYRSIV